MKKILLLIFISFILKTSNAQEVLNFPKWNFGFGALTTSNIYENFKRNDVIQLSPIRVAFGLVFTTKYTINNNFNCDLALEQSGNKLGYRSGKYNSGMSSNVTPKIHLRVNYIFSSSKKIKQTVGLGLVNLFSSSGYGATGYTSDTSGTTLNEISYAGWNPLIQLRYGILWQSKKMRLQQLNLYANKGFKTITAYTYKGFNPLLTSGSFNFSGTYCGIEYTWFLRKNKV